MGFSSAYGPADEAQSIRTVHRAIELGVTLFDTADVYGLGHNERLLAKALAGRRSRVLVASKFGWTWDEQGKLVGVDGSPAHVRAACEVSLSRLGTDYLDFYYLHRLDTNTPIEDSVGAMARLVEQGKVRYLGLCEVSAETLQRACSVYEVTVLQSEYSLWSREVEKEILPKARELGIGFVPYSPLGRGYLAGQVRTLEDLVEHDHRRSFPRFSAENLAANRALLQVVEEIATQRGRKPAQVALAWVLAQGEDIVPIPGTRSFEHLEENLGTLRVELTGQELRSLDGLASRVAGERFGPQAMRYIAR